MSSQFPPLTCKEVKQILKNLEFIPLSRKGTSHEQWRGYINGFRRTVTVDCPKEPFTNTLIKYMASQAGLSKKEFYASLDVKKARNHIKAASIISNENNIDISEPKNSI